MKASHGEESLKPMSKKEDKMNVLLVEDDPGVVYFLERTLSKKGHQVVSVNNGRMAARICKEQDFSLVVLETDLVRENGFEVCRMMRRQQIGTPILLMTDDNLPGTVAKTVEVGANGNLVKPFSVEDLHRKTRKFSNEARSERFVPSPHSGLSQIAS